MGLVDIRYPVLEVVNEGTVAALGTKTVVASAAANLSTTAEVSANATYSSTDAAVDCQMILTFTRLRTDPLGNT